MHEDGPMDEGGPEPSPGDGPRADRPIAALWRRVAARALDMLAIFWLQFAIAILLAGFGVQLRVEGSPEPWGVAFVGYVVYVSLFAIYESVYLIRRGQTPGKELLKLRVIDAATGANPTFGQVVRRSLLTWALRLIPGGYSTFGSAAIAVTGLPALVDSRARRTLGDLAAGTIVVHYDATIEEGPRPVVRRPGARRRGMFAIPSFSADDEDD
jgi:uncharacterized RDD family membrane protein YckC